MKQNKEYLERALEKAEEKFDEDYQYSEDFRYWSEHQQLKEHIQSIKQKLKEYEDTV